MSLLKIARMGHPVLRRRAEPIDVPDAANIRALAADMIETMLDAPGVGLAAPQVHASLRLIVFRVPAERSTGSAGDTPILPQILINPEITPIDASPVSAMEGCLSIPGLRGIVPRWNRIHYRGLDGEGRLVEREVAGFHARVIQHEVDHLDGVLYLDRMTDLTKLAFDAEARFLIGETDE